MVKLILVGFGSVNRVLLDILTSKKSQINALLNESIIVVGVSDSKGAIYNQYGLDFEQLLRTKKEKKSIIYYPANRDTKMFVDTLTMLGDKGIDYDILIDGSPVNLRDGSPGKQCTLFALQNGKKAILANKAPLVLAFDKLHRYSNNLRYSAAVCGGLPVVNILKHDLMAPYFPNSIKQMLGIFNSTSNYILDKMTFDKSITPQSALADAQRIGIAETDPSLDLNGSDTANKLCIIMNILGHKTSFSDIKRSGLETVSKAMISEALKEGKVYKMVASANKIGQNEWNLGVKCQKVEINSFLGQCKGTDMCIQIESDLFDTQFYKTNEKDVVATSAAVLRDIVSLTLNDQTYSIQTAKL